MPASSWRAIASGPGVWRRGPAEPSKTGSRTTVTAGRWPPCIIGASWSVRPRLTARRGPGRARERRRRRRHLRHGRAAAGDHARSLPGRARQDISADRAGAGDAAGDQGPRQRRRIAVPGLLRAHRPGRAADRPHAVRPGPRRAGGRMRRVIKDFGGRAVFAFRLDTLLLRNTALVVAFHRVQETTADADGLTVDVATFERYGRFFRDHFRVTPLRVLVDKLERGLGVDRELAI